MQGKVNIYRADVGEILTVAAYDLAGAIGQICEYVSRSQDHGDPGKHGWFEAIKEHMPLKIRALTDDDTVSLTFPSKLEATVEMLRLTLPGPCFISTSEF